MRMELPAHDDAVILEDHTMNAEDRLEAAQARCGAVSRNGAALLAVPPHYHAAILALLIYS